MEEERPLREAREAISQQEAGESAVDSNLETNLSQTSASSPSSSSGPRSGLLIGGVIVVVVLIIIGLVLLGQGLLGGEETTADAESPQSSESTLSVPGEFELTLDNEAAAVQVARVSKDDFTGKQTEDTSLSTAADAIPSRLTLASDVYTVGYEGDAPTGEATITIPDDAQPYQTLDLYGWYNDKWQFVASSVDSEGKSLTSADGALPGALALMQTAAATDPEVGADLLPTQSIPVEMTPHLTEVSAGTLTLGQNAALSGEVVPVPEGGYRTLVRVTNTGAIVDTASLSTLLADTTLQDEHNNTLLDMVTSGGYAGVNLDYQGVDPSQKAAFTAFVQKLADRLHEQELVLAVTLETPFQDGSNWDTGGQDWAAIGQTADEVRLQMPIEPIVYGDGEKAERLVVWAVRQIDRSKLVAVLNI
ncbi:MAG: hypothetical protein WAM60_18145, partial [Candidatus Promineifilaceae bacterium]